MKEEYPTRFCEICGDEIGRMSALAYQRAHKHCDLCNEACTECQQDD